MGFSGNNRGSCYRFPALMLGIGLLITMTHTTQVQASETESVSGTLHCPEDFVLPSNAIAYITLTDVSPLQASSSEMIARQFIHQPCQNPTAFELIYDPTKISERHLYAIQVRIALEDEVILTNTSAYPVITQGNPTVIDVHVRSVE